MSWNFQTQLNNLKIQVAQLSAGSVTNPLTSALNCASYPLNNATTLSAATGQNLNLNTSVGNSIIVNAPLSIPNHPLVITNNTSADSIVVSDSGSDTSVFRVDASGNVGIKANPSVPLAYDLTVNGNTLISGDLSANNIQCTSITAPNVYASNVVNNITAGTGLIKTGTSTNPTLTNTGVLGVSAGSSGISVSGTAQNPVINNTGVTQLTAGSGITLSSGVGNVTISTAPISGVVNSVTSDNVYVTVDNTNPANPVIQYNGIQSLTAGNSIFIGGGVSPTINWTGPVGFFNNFYKNVSDNGTPANNIYLGQAGQYSIVANPQTGGTDLNVNVYLSFGNGPALSIDDSGLGSFVITNGNQPGNNNISNVNLYVKYSGTDYYAGGYQLNPWQSIIFDAYPQPGSTNRVTFLNTQKIGPSYFNY